MVIAREMYNSVKYNLSAHSDWRASEASETLFTHECFANENQELRIGRLSSLSGKGTSRSSSRISLQSSPLRFLHLLQQTCPELRKFVNRASLPCSGNHFLVILLHVLLLLLLF